MDSWIQRSPGRARVPSQAESPAGNGTRGDLLAGGDEGGPSRGWEEGDLLAGGDEGVPVAREVGRQGALRGGEAAGQLRA
jgi:hypothetical protein